MGKSISFRRCLKEKSEERELRRPTGFCEKRKKFSEWNEKFSVHLSRHFPHRWLQPKDFRYNFQAVCIALSLATKLFTPTPVELSSNIFQIPFCVLIAISISFTSSQMFSCATHLSEWSKLRQFPQSTKSDPWSDDSGRVQLLPQTGDDAEHSYDG